MLSGKRFKVQLEFNNLLNEYKNGVTGAAGEEHQRLVAAVESDKQLRQANDWRGRKGIG